MPKKSFDIDLAIERIREAVKPFPKAAMFELAELGFASPFEQLVACVISIRTLDEVSLVAAQRLFARGRTPADIAALSPAEVEKLIRPSTFYERKAQQIVALAQRVQEEFNGDLPCDAEVIMSFSGVGLKCTNLALGIACGEARVSADVHVHRITNRWGYIATTSPERSSQVLEEKLPPRYRVEINRLLVPFGKHICTGNLPHCSTCPVEDMCQQVGVKAHR